MISLNIYEILSNIITYSTHFINKAVANTKLVLIYGE